MSVRTMFVIAVREVDRFASFHRGDRGFDARATGDPGWRMSVRHGHRIMVGQALDAA